MPVVLNMERCRQCGKYYRKRPDPELGDLCQRCLVKTHEQIAVLEYRVGKLEEVRA